MIAGVTILCVLRFHAELMTIGAADEGSQVALTICLYPAGIDCSCSRQRLGDGHAAPNWHELL